MVIMIKEDQVSANVCPVCQQLLKSERAAGGDQQEMRNILSEALVLVKTELDSLLLCSSRRENSQGFKVGGDRTLALLEQYAELLLKSVEKRRDTKT